MGADGMMRIYRNKLVFNRRVFTFIRLYVNY